MPSIRQQLQPDEKILYRARPTRIGIVSLLVPVVLVAIAVGAAWSMFEAPWVWIVGLIVLLPLVVLLLQRWIVFRSLEFVLTDRRLFKQWGIFTKQSTTTYLDMINNVDFKQTLWGRLFGYGMLAVDTASESGTTVFPGVSDPLRFKRAILIASEDHRERRDTRASQKAAPPVQPTAADRLRQAKSLLDDGLISADEYEAKRKKLLEEI